MFYGWDLLGDEVSLSGKLYSWMHIDQNQAYDYRLKMSRLLSSSQKGRLLGAYFLDFESQVFANLVEPSKGPLMYKGLDESIEASKDPEYDAIENGHMTYNGRHYNIEPIDMKMRSDEEIFITSVYVKFKIHQFASFPGNGNLFSIYSDRQMLFWITGNQQKPFIYGSGSYYHGHDTVLVTGVWYHWLRPS